MKYKSNCSGNIWVKFNGQEYSVDVHYGKVFEVEDGSVIDPSYATPIETPEDKVEVTQTPEDLAVKPEIPEWKLKVKEVRKKR